MAKSECESFVFGSGTLLIHRDRIEEEVKVKTPD